MGKPFAREVEALFETYNWSVGTPIAGLKGFITRLHAAPLFAIGSGGSLSASHLAGLLHLRTGQLARAVTPLEFAGLGTHVRNANVLLLSAGGSNPDILACFRTAAETEPMNVGAICMRTGSKLAQLAREFTYTELFDFDLPSGKDGFLATNSLLGLFVLLTRAYADAAHADTKPDAIPAQVANTYVGPKFGPFVTNDTLCVLHGVWGQPVAADLESKFTEAALGHVQVADFRNFAHGRHHWIAKHGRTSAVIALVSPADEVIARTTLGLMPVHVPVLTLRTPLDGPGGTIDLFAQSLHLVQAAGEANRIDPGRPGVPAFGSRIYNIKYSVSAPYRLAGVPGQESVAIYRKIAPRTPANLPSHELGQWRTAYRSFVRGLESSQFRSVVCDYDGTLCDPKDRFTGLQDNVGEGLRRLLRGGVFIGIATGRGKSVRGALLAQIPSELRENVLVGYYNCAYIHSLEDELSTEATSETPCEDLADLVRSLQAAPDLCALAEFTVRRTQITLLPRSPGRLSDVVAIVVKASQTHSSGRFQYVQSGHSIDILAPGVSKLALVDAISRLVATQTEPSVLCIGDRGRWPGNDYALLKRNHALSVHEVSADPGTCWNLAPPGQRGSQAALYYLSRLTVEHGSGIARLVLSSGRQ